MHVCKRACVHVCICACEHVCMCACVNVSMCACVHVCICACEHVCMCASVHACMCACVHVCSLAGWRMWCVNERKTYHIKLHVQYRLRDDEHKTFETCRRLKELKYSETLMQLGNFIDVFLARGNGGMEEIA